MNCKCGHEKHEHDPKIDLVEIIKEQQNKTRLETAKQILEWLDELNYDMEASEKAGKSVIFGKPVIELKHKIKAKFLQDTTKRSKDG